MGATPIRSHSTERKLRMEVRASKTMLKKLEQKRRRETIEFQERVALTYRERWAMKLAEIAKEALKELGAREFNVVWSATQIDVMLSLGPKGQPKEQKKWKTNPS